MSRGLRLAGLSKHYGQHKVVDSIDLEVEPGAFVVLVGPSGCGKSTVLRMIAGLVEPSAGTIEIAGREVTALPPGRRDVAMVFQSYALYPHMNVFENIAYPLRVRGVRGEALRREVDEVADTLGLAALLDRRPAALSGGQRQRVAMGRAMVRRPQVFLFDEPLSNLDAALRGQMRSEIARLQKRLGTTTIYVTHDQHEAMTLADRLVLLRDGRIEQAGAPLSVYAAPQTRFAAEFLGSPPMGFLRVTSNHGTMECCGWPVPESLASLARGSEAPALAPAWLGVRPEHWRVVPPGEGIAANVNWVEHTGSDRFVYASVGDAQVVVRVRHDIALSVGQSMGLEPEQARIFDHASGQAVW